MGGEMEGWKDDLVHGRMGGEMEGRVDGWVHGWVGGRVDGWVHGWVGGRVDGWGGSGGSPSLDNSAEWQTSVVPVLAALLARLLMTPLMA